MNYDARKKSEIEEKGIRKLTFKSRNSIQKNGTFQAKQRYNNNKDKKILD